MANRFHACERSIYLKDIQERHNYITCLAVRFVKKIVFYKRLKSNHINL